MGGAPGIIFNCYSCIVDFQSKFAMLCTTGGGGWREGETAMQAVTRWPRSI